MHRYTRVNLVFLELFLFEFETNIVQKKVGNKYKFMKVIGNVHGIYNFILL